MRNTSCDTVPFFASLGEGDPALLILILLHQVLFLPLLLSLLFIKKEMCGTYRFFGGLGDDDPALLVLLPLLLPLLFVKSVIPTVFLLALVTVTQPSSSYSLFFSLSSLLNL